MLDFGICERNSIMAVIQAIGTAVPPYIFPQAEVSELVQEIFASVSNLERYLSIYQNTGITKRHFVVPKEWFRNEHSLAEKNKMYVQEAITLSEKAIRNCLEQVKVSVSEIDHLIFISSTGIATPSIDAHLCQRIGFSQHIKRTPIWGLGCAGGAVGLSRAYEYVRAFPTHRALVIAVELCGLTFLRNDRSKSNIVATSLFADGAAAVLIAGEQVSMLDTIQGPKILGSMSTIFPHSLDVMGWELNDEGLKVIFSRDIPTIVNEVVYKNITDFLATQKINLQDIDHFILHPGGKKVLDAYEAALGIGTEKTHVAREIIEEYGNMSSATILFVLQRHLSKAGPINSGDYGLLAALGPGFSSECLLVQW